MSEWFKETVLKTVDAQASRGSNPRFSEMERWSIGLRNQRSEVRVLLGTIRKDARVVESDRLEICCRLRLTGGSNPPLSVRLTAAVYGGGFFTK